MMRISNFNKFFRLEIETLKSIAKLFLSVVAVKGIVISREIAVAYYYGVSELIDNFIIAFTWLTWLPGLWMSVTLVTVIPLIRRDINDYSKNRFMREFIGLGILIGAISILVIFIVITCFKRSIFPGVPDESLIQLKMLLFYLSPLALLNMLAVSYSVIILTKEALLTTISESLPPFCMLCLLAICISVLGVSPNYIPLISGCLLGYLIWNISLFVLNLKLNGFIIPYFSFRSKLWREFSQDFILMLLGSGILSLTVLTDQVMVMHLGEGAVAVLGYTNRILSFIFSLTSPVLARTFIPSYSDFSQPRDHLGFNALKWSFIIGSSGSLITWFGYSYSKEISTLVFGRGRFSADDVQKVSQALKYGFFQLPFYLGGNILSYFISGIKKYRILVLVVIIMLAIKIFLNLKLLADYGPGGAYLSSTGMYISSCVLLSLYIFFHEIKGDANKR